MFVNTTRHLFSLTAVWAQRRTTRGFGRGISKGPRLHGTITGFKHRRGYGFILSEGVVGARDDGKHAELLEPSTYFFTRSQLDGGFYITEGERVSFEDASRGSSPASGKDSFRILDEPERVDDAGPRARAINVRMYDIKTQKESPVEPVMLLGKVIRWDAAGSCGVVGELDTEGEYHEGEAPKFSFSLDDVDLPHGSEMWLGRYVRFCLERDDVDAGVTDASGLRPARRVILDRQAERRHGAMGRPIVPASAPRGTVSASTRFTGTIRELHGRFGFVQDELSGESIFMHAQNMTDRGMREGDRVTYMLREMRMGKHAGKKSCFDIRRDSSDSVPQKRNEDDDDDEFNLFD